jgi:DNA modification methylase
VTQNGQEKNRLISRDGSFHEWYRFVLAYPPHLVQDYMHTFKVVPGQVVLDPFCGTGTTLIEAKLAGIESAGIEANPFAHFASTVKLDWALDADALTTAAKAIAEAALARLQAHGIDDEKPFEGDLEGLSLRTLDAASSKLLITDSVSPLPLHKTLVLLDCLREHRREEYYNHALLALANALVFSISNLRFGPEVGVGKIRADVPVVTAWLSEVGRMALDLRLVTGRSYATANVYLADARQGSAVLRPESIDVVITSPPYPNEKDYTRTTRLESVILGLITDKKALQKFKRRLVRSNTRVVYKGDDDDAWIESNPEIKRIADEIEQRRMQLGKTSGFERLYSKVTRLYFGGMARHLADLRTVLRPGANLAYVVGDQASYLRVMIRTGHLLADVAESLGFEPIRIDLFRTRFSTATKEQLREEVVILRWPGYKGSARMSTKRIKDASDVARDAHDVSGMAEPLPQLIL